MKRLTKIAAISAIAILPLTACSGDDKDKGADAIKNEKTAEIVKLETKPSADMKKTEAKTEATDTPHVAIVNGVKISELMFAKHVEYRTRGKQINLTPDQRKAVINDLISLELLKQDAIKKNLDKRPEIVATIENVKRGEIAQANVNDLKVKSMLSEEQLKKEYDEFAKNSSVDFNASHILVKTEEEAKKVITEIDGGADFAEAAKKYSVGPTGVKGGELGWFGPNQMVPEFTEAVKKLEIGAYTKAPIKTKFGWHVILLKETRPTTIPPYEQMKKQLQMKAETKAIQSFINDLKENAKIEIVE
mgnify:CR=1 FL=1